MEWIALIAVLILWQTVRSRTNQVHKELHELRASTAFQEQVIQQLTRRVFDLENGAPPAPVPAVLPVPVPVPVAVVVETLAPKMPPEMASQEMAAPALDREDQRILEEELLTPPPPIPAGPSYSEQLRERMKGVEWEALIGGSWLNAIGVLILVVGVALFLGYALTELGPVGKISIGALVSLMMLGAGVWAERKERYIIFGRGLIAGGWAALYFTTYAMHALDASRVIESPVLGGILLLAVACGMIAHSLRYHSQNITLLAYFTAYFALQIGPLTWLSIAATIPLAISLLTISRTLGWNVVPVIGIVLTYFTFAFRYRPEELIPIFGTAALYTYWVAFEIHDLLKLRTGTPRSIPDITLFPLNALMMLGTAMLTLPKSTPIESSYFLATAGALFLTSTILRKRWQAVILPEALPWVEILSQSYRFALALSATLFAGALLRRFDVERSTIGLLLEAQLLVLAGLRSGDRFFCHVGAVVFGYAAMALLGRSHDFGQLAIGRHKFGGWVPFSFAMAVQYGINRWLIRGGAYYTWGALGMLMLGSGELLHNAWTGVAWIGIALVAVELHLRTAKREFFYQSAVAGVCGFIALLAVDEWPALLTGAALLALAAVRSEKVREFACGMAAITAASAAWHGLPAPLVAPAWALISLALLEVGSVSNPRIAWQGHALGMCAMGRLYVANFTVLTETAGISHRLWTVTPMLAFAWHMWRNSSGIFQRIWSWTGVLVLGSLLRFELGRTLVVLGWAGLMLLLLSFGIRRQNKDFLWQGYVLGVLAFARGWATNFSSNETLLGMPERILIGIFVIAAFHTAEFLLTREHRYGRTAFALMGVALLSILLYYEVQGSLLTIAWGAQAVALVIAGFAVQERTLRLAGLGMFGVCILKLFFYDLRNLETLSRILSFIVLGLVLMGASWLYMRFREKIQRYL